MARIYFNFSIAVIAISFLLGCSNSSSTSDDASEQDENIIVITQKQFEADSMMLGEVDTAYFEDIVKCNGYISASSDGLAQISSLLSGVVASVDCSLGDYVQKGRVLCSFNSHEFIALQQDYSESTSKLIRIESEYKRIKALFDEKIGAEKDLIAIESEYKAMKARQSILKIKLSGLGLNVAKIADCQFYESYQVTAPISGYITEHYLVLGQFAEQQKKLIEIVDVDKLQLLLSVFETDINKLQTEQKVQFSLLEEPNTNHLAKMVSIGKTIDAESKTIQCVAKIDNSNGGNFINRSFIEAQIIVAETKTYALPNEAVFKNGNDYYVFVVENSENQSYSFKKTPVNIGRISKKHTEILDSKNLGQVLIKGGYNIQTE